MAEVFNRYPLVEVIIHPRTASQKYEGVVNHEAFDIACEVLKHEVVYSGDISSVESFQEIRGKHPKIRKWMIGRGILKDPHHFTP